MYPNSNKTNLSTLTHQKLDLQPTKERPKVALFDVNSMQTALLEQSNFQPASKFSNEAMKANRSRAQFDSLNKINSQTYKKKGEKAIEI